MAGRSALARMLDSDVFHSFRSNPVVVVSAAITALFVLAAAFAPLPAPLRLASAWPTTSVRKMPSLRSTARRAFGESASLRPVVVLPAAERPLYSKTGMAV